MAETIGIIRTDAHSAIEAATLRFMDLFQQGDAAGVAQLYADDALLLPPGAPIVRGATAIRQALQGLIDQGVERLELRTERLDIREDTAYEVGFATVHIRLPDGQAIQDPGKYVVVWKRQGTDWKLVVDIFNSDTPQP